LARGLPFPLIAPVQEGTETQDLRSEKETTMETSRPGLKLSGQIAPDDLLHRVAEAPGQTIAPTEVYIPGIGYVPQYAPTISSPAVGYDPAHDCEGYYMSYKFQPNNNCYNYSTNMASNSFAQPGRRHGYKIPQPPTGPGVQAGAELDGLVRLDDSDLASHRAANDGASGHYVALLISEADTPNGWPGDYHWVRCDDNDQFAFWSQKDGNDQVTNFDFAGNLIADPAKANWTVNQGPISKKNPDDLIVSYQFFCYMWVPWGQIEIL
jgi:hypothetical protein